MLCPRHDIASTKEVDIQVNLLPQWVDKYINLILCHGSVIPWIKPWQLTHIILNRQANKMLEYENKEETSQ